MSSRRPRRNVSAAVVAGAAALATGGCVYLNALYNADRVYAQGERARLEGRDSIALAAYDSVVSKAARGYRREPDGEWADDALFLLGRAYLRQRDIPRARETLLRVLDISDDPAVRSGATLYLGALAVLDGDRGRALELLNDALRGLESGPLLAEGHLWRARANLAAGLVDAGWWDLDRAREADPRLSSAADLERVVWGIARDDSTRARLGASRLLGGAPVHTRADTLARLVHVAGDRWGPAAAASLLERADRSPWPPDELGRLVLLRAELRLRAGDTVAARADALHVADGFGSGAARARLFLAGMVLGAARSVEELERVRPILLPASGDAEVVGLLESVRKVELLARRGRTTEPVALFAAAELARDVLGAPRLARALFIDYADRAGTSPWAGKALLAAVALRSSASDDADTGSLAERLERLETNPYVRAARTGWFPSAEFERLESALRGALERVLTEVTAEAVQLDVLLRGSADTLR